MSLSPSALRPGVTHVFLAHPEGLLAAAPHHADWLSAPERARAERYRVPGGATRYRATRVLVRGVLAGLLGRPPGELEFVELAHGRPALRDGTATLDFNVSRCPSWVALVVTAGIACGVDVEDVTREANFLGIARAFAPAERSLLEAATPEERRRLFFQAVDTQGSDTQGPRDGPQPLAGRVRLSLRRGPPAAGHLLESHC